MATAIAFTARDVITQAFSDLGVFQPGESIPAPDANGALSRLNAFISGMSQSPLTFPYVGREVFNVIANQSTYTIGPGGDFDTVRPTALTGAGLLMPSLGSPTGQVEIPIAPMTDDAYQLCQVKDQTSALWTDIYFNATYTDGFATVFLWPTPTTTQNQCVLYFGSAIRGFANLTTQYDFPPGVFEMLEYELGKRLAPSYGGTGWTAELEGLRKESMFVYKRNNFKLTDAPVDPAMTHTSRGGYVIQTGTGG